MFEGNSPMITYRGCTWALALHAFLWISAKAQILRVSSHATFSWICSDLREQAQPWHTRSPIVQTRSFFRVEVKTRGGVLRTQSQSQPDLALSAVDECPKRSNTHDGNIPFGRHMSLLLQRHSDTSAQWKKRRRSWFDS